MIPIHELLSRIRWDASFAKGRFVIGYWDRLAGRVLRADLREISWDVDNPTFFDLVDEEGLVHSIPFHRVREVWRDGSLIWPRHPAGDLRGNPQCLYQAEELPACRGSFCSFPATRSNQRQILPPGASMPVRR
jgi:uncharacterized protein (UPF0248 family)